MEKEILDLLKSINIFRKKLSDLNTTSIKTKINVANIKEELENDVLILTAVKKTIDSNLKLKWF